jgi:CubicO group peptidase (beta-lactamase class C family)
MKTIISSILLLVLFINLFTACTGKAGSKIVIDDSLAFYPPTPKELTKEQFRQYYNKIQTFYDTALSATGFNGGILIAKNGVVIFEKYRGFEKISGADTMGNVFGTDSITAETSFQLASTSKTFTGMAVLKLAQEGKLNLDDSLPVFFSGFPHPSVTVKMLLNHRSGLPNYVYYLATGKRDKKKTIYNEEVLESLTTLKPQLNFPVGTHFSYCNTNYVLLAMIIEKVTGQSFASYMKTNFFDPLDMKNTFVYTPADSGRVFLSYYTNGRVWKNDFLDGTYGDKNIYSTPRDLLKWDQALYGGKLLTQTTLDSAYKGYSFERPSIHNYGLGWRLMLLQNGKKVIYHNGWWHGFNAAFGRLTDEKAAIIILGNKRNENIYSARLLYNMFGDYLQQEVLPPETAMELHGEKNEAYRRVKKTGKVKSKK